MQVGGSGREARIGYLRACFNKAKHKLAHHVHTIRWKLTLKLWQAIGFPLTSIMSQNFDHVDVVALTCNPTLKNDFEFETLSWKQESKQTNKFH